MADVHAIEFDSVVKIYANGRKALDGVSFAVETGSIFGLLGPNGAGKTTALRILTTLLSPSSGQVCIMGVDVVKKSRDARRLFGFVSQEIAVDECLTGKENLLLQARMHGIGTTAASRIDEALALVGLSDRADDPAESYSGGMRKRLDLASSLLHRPTVLILDEPTLGLDVWARREMWTAISRLKEETSMTILLTTHYLEEADRLCDEVAILDAGRIKVMAPPSRLKREAGGDVISAWLSAPAGDLDDALARVAALPGTIDARRTGNKYRIAVTNLEEVLPSLIESAKGWRARIDRIQIERTGLADAYLGATATPPPRNADEGSKRDR